MAENKQEPDAVFTLERIYLKDVSYEAPGAPLAFAQNEAPQLDVQLRLEHAALNAQDGYHEVVLTVAAHANRADKTVFLAEVQQAGAFRITGIAGEALARTLEIGCAYILLPFAREVINDLVTKGGFPQLLINPINFEALYEQKQAAIKQPVAGQA
ncbi:MAG: protein-export chaperone SecB [Candidatus Muproteobacteria bacterium RIFCSPHIGHO2_01_FULL_65_16]|uniref:Protein-export chaperone SecB n=2 Tax=Candidatus Muproteobacteria TaxID=1817795 RepID=A0A1F6TAF4_9PROT|nr:MAG: protein-export chaperone SecB [Candidatus Muproteobacteria bacterium RBG_16_65_31]OGI46216.1 MAG: protein-export chaperone SecB [Candidatus Muproteobacteria bacterium RIFCSPHIGHO2_01_FULL_65_16]